MPGIRKNSNTGILLGVCSGFSEWSGLPVNLVRVATFAAFLFSLSLVGGGYVVLAGILSDTAQCSLRRAGFWRRARNIFRPWWRSDFTPT